MRKRFSSHFHPRLSWPSGAMLMCTLFLAGCEVAVAPVAVLAGGIVAALAGGGSKKQAQISVSSSSLGFGDQVIVVASDPRTISLTNSGNANLQVSGVTSPDLNGTDFRISGCNDIVVPGNFCTLSITFSPSSVGPKRANFKITSNAKNLPPDLVLTGTGTLPPPPVITPVEIDIPVIGVAPTNYLQDISAEDDYTLPLTVSIKTNGSVGVASVPDSGESMRVNYAVEGHIDSGTATDKFVIEVSNGYTSAELEIPVNLTSDPLLPNQWHINNVGQNTFSSTLPSAGNDMNVAGAWSVGVSGKDVKVAVIDDGLEGTHEDLAGNFDLDGSFNFITQQSDPSPADSSSHGTKVAGIIAAVGHNGVGVRGVAYSAVLRGYNLLAKPLLQADEIAGAFGGAGYSDDNDIFNASLSFNFSINNQAILPSVSNLREAILSNAATTLREGRGASIVQSAGNSYGSLSRGNCNQAITLGVSCGNVASDPMRATADIIVAAAINAEGQKSSYSTAGPGIWIAAPGGEFGYSAQYVNASALAYKPAIVTTARTGCQHFRFGSSINDLDRSDGSNPAAAQCQYTATMNGTSSAAPNVSAVIALMLEANPALSLRDVKHILAETAQQNDAAFPGISTTTLWPVGTSLQLEQPWIQNAAGYWFSHRYGFGSIDAAAAVDMAEQFAGLPERVADIEVAQAISSDQAIGNGSSKNILFRAPSTVQKIENVRVEINLSTDGVRCNQIELVSPSQTKSILLAAGSGFSNTRLTNTRFLSNAFYGEPSGGDWTLTIRNTCQSASAALQANSRQSLLIQGH